MTAQSMREIPRPEISTARPAPGDLRPRPASAGWWVAGRRVAERVPPARLVDQDHRPAQDHQSCDRQPLRATWLLGAVVGAGRKDGGLAA